MSASFVLSLVFLPEQVRQRYALAPQDAYTRELNRAQNLLLSMRAVNTTLPVTVLVGGNRSTEHEERLRRTFPETRLHPVSPLPIPSWASGWHKHSFQKLAALGLTHYDRVVFLDNDCQLRANIDFLPFAVRPPAAVWIPATGLRDAPSVLNSGLLVLQPSATTFSTVASRLLLPAPAGDVPLHERDGSDQQLLLSMKWNWTQLPLGFNANRALCMSEKSWKDVRVLHLINGFEYSKRSPAWVEGRTFWKRRR